MCDDLTMQIANVVGCTEAEGPGKRFAVWFQGCPLRCPGCCNPEYLPFHGGITKSLSEMIQWMEQVQSEEGIEGISLLGGEPFAHTEGAVGLATEAKQRGLTVMIYSGYTIEEIRDLPDPAAKLLYLTDVLVDGPFIRELPDTERRWVGSTNQRVHLLSNHYRSDDPCWRQRNTLEIRVRLGEVALNGFPAPGAVGLWKPKWLRKR